MKAQRKVALQLILIILLSGFFGVIVGVKLERKANEQRNNPEAWHIHAMRTLEHRLHLSPEQSVAIRGRLESAVGELKAIRLDTIGITNAVLDRVVDEIEKELRPDQLAEFEKLKKERSAATLDMLKVEPKTK